MKQTSQREAAGALFNAWERWDLDTIAPFDC